MSNDFWSKKLGRQAPQQPPPGPPQGYPAAQRAWWDQSAPPPPPAPQQAIQLYDQFGRPVPQQAYEQQGDPNDLPPQEIARMTKSARKAKGSNSTCPECSGPNYTVIGTQFFRNAGQVEQRRCFDCGYPVVQQFSGMSSVRGGEAVGTARQVAHGGSVNNARLGSTDAPTFAAPHGGPGR